MTQEAKVISYEEGSSATENASEEDATGDNVMSIRMAKLIKLRKQLKMLNKEVSEDHGSRKMMEIECNKAFKEINTILGELHDAAGGKESISS